VINLVTTLSDSEGDATSTAPLVDIVRVDGGFNQDVLTLSAFFSSATDMNNLVGYIHLDTDQDPATGFPPAAQFGNANQDLGADYFLNLFSLPSLGVIGVFDQNSNFITEVVPILQNRSLRLSIPLSALGGDDGQVNLSMVLGNHQNPTDWAPDMGHAQIGPVEWLTVAPSAGTVAGGGTTVVAVTFDATNLGPGIFTANLVIHDNDPVQSTVVVPVTLTVTSSGVVVPSLSYYQDPVDRTAGIIARSPLVIDPATGNELTVLLGSFQALLTYDVNCLSIVDVRALDFSITDLNIDNINGATIFNGTSDAGVAATGDLALALTRPVGSNQQHCTLTVEIANLTDPEGAGLDVIPQPASIDFLRGDARADGVIDIADAMFIAQYLVGSRSACTREGDGTCVHLVNAASVHQDGGIDQPTIDDALYITQYLAGLRDESYDPLP
jgi:hypothetical protein